MEEAIWEEVCKRFGIKNWYDAIHWIYRDDSDDIKKFYESLYVGICNQIIKDYLAEV